MATKVQEIRNDQDLMDIMFLAEAHRNECASHLPFVPEAIFRTGDMVFKDLERKNINAWIVRKEGKPVGYSVGYTDYFFFNNEKISKLECWYVLPEARGSWAAVKLVKAYEEWARLNGALEIFTGVARTDKDEAKHIRQLFPKLGYDWRGSYYAKETVRG